VRWQLRESRNGHTDTQYVWLDPKLRTALKVQMDPPTIELQNIQDEMQAAGFFAIPAVHRQMDVGGRGACYCHGRPFCALQA
jgi:hypothetical protein